LFSERSLRARLLRLWETLAARAADLVVVCSPAGIPNWRRLFGIAPPRIGYAHLGAELDAFPPRPLGISDPDAPIKVLFYGTLIPSHGIATIVAAARLLAHEAVDFTIIGQGQESDLLQQRLAERPLPRLRWIPWVPYRALAEPIHAADVCLGIFADSARAETSVPTKVQ
jgi:glycosyltransferase involved in cell wall biosynthesis